MALLVRRLSVLSWIFLTWGSPLKRGQGQILRSTTAAARRVQYDRTSISIWAEGTGHLRVCGVGEAGGGLSGLGNGSRTHTKSRKGRGSVTHPGVRRPVPL